MGSNLKGEGELATWADTMLSAEKWSKRNLLPMLVGRFHLRDGLRLCASEVVARTRIDPAFRRLFCRWTWTVITRSGIKLELRPFTADLHIFHEIWDFHVYDPPHVESWHPRVVVDVGAHIGLYAMYAAAAFRPDTIIAIEPEPTNFGILVRNIRNNKLTNTKVVKAAIVGHARRVLLYRSVVNSGGHSIIRTDGEPIPVEGLDINDVLERSRIDNVDLMKMDCEGAELEILLETPETTIRKIARIVFEYNLDAYGVGGLEKITNRLRKLGLFVAVFPSSRFEGIVFATNSTLSDVSLS